MYSGHDKTFSSVLHHDVLSAFHLIWKETWIFHRNACFHLVMFLMRIYYVFLFTPKMRRHFCFNEYVRVFVLGRICLAFSFVFSFYWRLWMNAIHWFYRDGTNTKNSMICKEIEFKYRNRYSGTIAEHWSFLFWEYDSFALRITLKLHGYLFNCVYDAFIIKF